VFFFLLSIYYQSLSIYKKHKNKLKKQTKQTQDEKKALKTGFLKKSYPQFFFATPQNNGGILLWYDPFRTQLLLSFSCLSFALAKPQFEF